MSGGQLNADVEQYLQAAGMNAPPPQIISDPLITGVTPIEQLLRVLGIAANLSDPADNATAAEQHAERDAKTKEAAEKFAAQDEQAAEELNAIAPQADPAAQNIAAQPDQGAAMAQQLPQMASGITGALAGALGGALQPLAQIPQQATQGLQQAVQTGLGLFQQASGANAGPSGDAALTDIPPSEDFGSGLGDVPPLAGGAGEVGLGAGDIGAGGGGFGAGGGTAPTAYLGPPPIPSASTAPSSAPITPVTPAPLASGSAPGAPGMAGMPMVPPAAMAGAAGSDKDPKADTKRVSVQPVRNGAPVQGRLTAPPAMPPVVKKSEGAPAVTRRIVAPIDRSGDAKSDS